MLLFTDRRSPEAREKRKGGVLLWSLPSMCAADASRRGNHRQTTPLPRSAAATSRRRVEAGAENAEAVGRRRCCCEQGIPSRSGDLVGARWSASRAREESGKKGTPRAVYAVRAPLLRRGKPASPATWCFAEERRMTTVGGACLPIA
nr:hypothetical protein Iba_chr09eCG13910 [Ipomoea batatas]